MNARLVGKAEARRAATASIDDLEKRFAQNLNSLIHDMDGFIKSVTPVNTGQAVRNYIWSRDVANSVVYDAIDNGPPGPTNSMALGQEPRRKVNEDAAAASLKTLNIVGNPFAVFTLTNLSPDIEGLELGILPGPPLKSRSPAGMFGLTESLYNVKIAAKGIIK